MVSPAVESGRCWCISASVQDGAGDEIFYLEPVMYLEQELQLQRAEDGYEKICSYRGIWPRAGRASHTGRSDFCEDWSATSEARGCDRSTEPASCLGAGLLSVFRFAVCMDAGLLGDSAPAPDCVGTWLLESTARLVCLGERVLEVGCGRPSGPATSQAGSNRE